MSTVKNRAYRAMIKSDVELQSDVMEELAFEPNVDAAHIGVTAKEGVVTLTGSVGTYAEKSVAERITKRVAGVRGIAADIEARVPGLSYRNDADIVAAALHSLAADMALRPEEICVQVENGWLTLEGFVHSQYQKERVKETVANAIGVRGVTNIIVVLTSE